VKRGSGSSPSRVSRRSLVTGGARIDLVLLDGGEVLFLRLDEELFDAEVALGVVRREELELLDEILGDVSVGIGELEGEKEKGREEVSFDFERKVKRATTTTRAGREIKKNSRRRWPC